MKKLIILFFISFPLFSYAGEWCDLTKGFGITENRGSITVNGGIKNSSGTGKHHEWIVINVPDDDEATQARLALIMSAKMANLNVKLYVRDTCVGLSNWTADQILHVRI